MKVSDLFVKCLEVEGVKYVFGLPGEENEDLLFSLEKSPIKFISTRHEQGAAFMADVWGRLTGTAGVCLATLGPGATNLITGLADANMDKSPVVAITGQGSSERLHKESHQAIDVVNMLRPITKWNTSIYNPSITVEAIRKAFKLAELEKPGVTHIELPEDIAKLEVDIKKPLIPATLRRSGVDYKALDQAVALIKKSKKPVVIAGNGAIRKMASKHLRELVEKFNIPVVATFMGKGAVSDKDSHSLFSMGLRGKDFPIYAIHESDLIISVGFDIAEYSPDIWNINPSKPIIHMDFTHAEVYESYQPTLEMIADVSDSLRELRMKLEEEKAQPFSNWYMKIREAILKDMKSYEKKGKSITIPWVLSVIRKVMRDEDIIISDVGAHKMWIGRNFPVYTPGTCIISNGFATMGIALPGGLAAKLAFPERNIVTVSGDGGFLMNSQEIETAKRYKIPYTIVVLNDNDYGLISWKQKSHTGKSFGTTLTNPDYKKYGESFGIKTYVPKTRIDVEKSLSKAINSNELTLVAIDIDSSENLKLTKKLNSKLL